MTEHKNKLEFWRWYVECWQDPDIDWKADSIITAGVDVGSLISQAVILELCANSNMRTSPDSPNSSIDTLNLAFEGNGLLNGIHYTARAGYGRIYVPFTDRTITEIACHARCA